MGERRSAKATNTRPTGDRDHPFSVPTPSGASAATAVGPYDSQIDYRLEYVTGPVFARTYPVHALFHVFNRGNSEEHIRTRLWGEGGLGSLDGPPELLFDSGDLIVPPREAALTYSREIETDPFIFLLLWARIYTTSPNVVPSVSFWDPLVGNRILGGTVDGKPWTRQVDDLNVPFAYYAPGDFARFELRERLVDVPPVGPAEG